MNTAPDMRSLLGQGMNHHRQGDLQGAVSLYQRVLKDVPNQPDALHFLGLIAHQTGNNVVALSYLELAAKLAPGNAEIWSNYGALNLTLKRPKEAEQCFTHFVQLAPQHAGAHYALGTALLEQFRATEAERHLRTALTLSPELAEAHGNLGHALQQQGRLTEAEAALREAIRRDARLQPAWRTLSVTLEQQGRVDEAHEAYRQALALNPDDAATHSALLLSLHFAGNVTKDELQHEALRFGERYANVAPLALPEKTGKKLRVGYLSADLHEHPVAYFLESVLGAHDKSAFEVYCYASQYLSDATTSRLMAQVHTWRDIAALSDASAAALIAQDGLDLLVDLSGHTGKNRLGILAHRPARAQASWLGYFDTTGMGQVDTLIADERVLPAGEEKFYREKILRLPEYFLCFSAPREAEEVAPLPAEKNGYVTFGSFNKLAKLDAPVIRLWSEILHSVPESKLYLKTKALADSGVRGRVVNLFAAERVGENRLVLEGHSPLSEMYRAYEKMDIALDPFPHNGSTTNLQALYMGVPVLTLAGDRYVARMGASINEALGATDWTAATPAEYAQKAARFAADIQALSALRAGMRKKLRASPLMDAKAFTRALEGLYRKITG